MLKEVMKFKSEFAIENDGFIRIYQDPISEYFVMPTTDGIEQFEKRDFLNHMHSIFDNFTEEQEVLFEKNGQIKELINKAIALLVVKGKYLAAIEYIEKIMNAFEYSIDKKQEENEYCVACGRDGLFVYSESEINDVIEQNGYIAPKIIKRFKDYDEAHHFVNDHYDEYDPECDFNE